MTWLLTVLFGLCIATPACANERPMTGTHVKRFAPIDKAVTKFMDKINCRAAAIAISHHGRILYSRGYGWKDKAKKQPTQPTTLFRIASVSKPITAAIIRILIRAMLISSDTKAFEHLKILPRTDSKKIDARLKDITISHLLEHKAGWDRKKAFDPMFRMKRIQTELHLKHSPTASDVVKYMTTQPLQFTPGEKREYSNVGYCVLGRVIEKATKRSYAQALQKYICEPLKIKDLKLGRSEAKDRDSREVWYPVETWFSVEVMDAHGGLIASAPALCKFMDNYWISGEPRKRGERRSYAFFGSLPGTTSMIRQRPDGYNVAVLFNGRRDLSIRKDTRSLKQWIDDALDIINKKK